MTDAAPGTIQEEMMTDQEAAALAALKEYALTVRAYNKLVGRPNLAYPSPEYIEAANAMEAANDAALGAVEPLLPTDGAGEEDA